MSGSGNILIICWKLKQKKLAIKNIVTVPENGGLTIVSWCSFFAISKISTTQNLSHGSPIIFNVFVVIL